MLLIYSWCLQQTLQTPKQRQLTLHNYILLVMKTFLFLHPLLLFPVASSQFVSAFHASNLESCWQVATFIVQKILLDDVGLDYICTTAERFFAVGRVLGSMVGALAEQPSSRLLKHIIRCYLRLSDNPRWDFCKSAFKYPFSSVMYNRSGFTELPPFMLHCERMLVFMVYGRACDALRNCLPDMLRDATFSSCLRVCTFLVHLFR